MTNEELVTACHEYVLAQQTADAPEAAEAKWLGCLQITPDIVAEILDSNKEE